MDFNIFSKGLKDFAAEVHGLRTKIEALERLREDVIFARACRADVVAAMEAWIARSKVAYAKRLGVTLSRLQFNAEALADPHQVDGIMKANGLTGEALHPVLAFQADQALAAIVGDKLIESLRAAVAAAPWPADGEGIPFAARAGEVAKIDAQLDKLRAEHTKLIADAAKAGLQVEQ